MLIGARTHRSRVYAAVCFSYVCVFVYFVEIFRFYNDVRRRHNNDNNNNAIPRQRTHIQRPELRADWYLGVDRKFNAVQWFIR